MRMLHRLKVDNGIMRCPNHHMNGCGMLYLVRTTKAATSCTEFLSLQRHLGTCYAKDWTKKSRAYPDGGFHCKTKNQLSLRPRFEGEEACYMPPVW